MNVSQVVVIPHQRQHRGTVEIANVDIDDVEAQSKISN
jgi:hypothetical protein